MHTTTQLPTIHFRLGPQTPTLPLFQAASDLALAHRAAPRRRPAPAPEPVIDAAACGSWLAGDPSPPPPCPRCDGWGRFGDDVECGACRGTGERRASAPVAGSDGPR